jgi:hypothetical protein
LVDLAAYPWFEVSAADAPLTQGDLLRGCPLVVSAAPFAAGAEVEAEAVEYDVVVMTQACDLEHDKVSLVLLCPFFSLATFVGANTAFDSKKAKERIRKGHEPAYHLINRCETPGHETDFLVVDFRSVYSLHVDHLKAHALRQGERLTLLPPYREHLSQAFARFMMRVGLPVDIPTFA